MPPVESQPCCAGPPGGAGAAVAAALQFFAASQCLVQEPWPPQADIINGSSFGFIIVGGGTAGATLAARLSEMKNYSVLLIEAGTDPPKESIVPRFKDVLLASPFDWNFTTVNDGSSSQALSGGCQLQHRGKMLGGSGSLNSMIYSRGFPADYNEWASIAGSDWDWENVLPYFKKTEHMTDQSIISNEELMKYHGCDGEIEVSGFNQSFNDIEQFLKAFKEIGFDLVDDMTYPHKIGAGRFSHTIRDGKRDSSLTALLNKVKGDNIFVLKNALVTKILLINSTAIGVNVLTDDNELRFFAEKEVIISAGTFNTAKLLMLSGIGPKDHLEDMGIKVNKDLPVGNNLHDHVMVLNYIAAENGTCYKSEAAGHMDMIQYLYDRTGYIARADSMGALLALKDSKPNTPDFAFYPTCTPQNDQFYEGCVSVVGFENNICAQLHAENQNQELITIAVVLLKPKSRGMVRLRSADPLDDPLIYSGTFNNPDDLEGFPEAVDVVHSLAETSYFKQKFAYVVDVKIDACYGLKGSDEVKCKVKAMVTSAWHAVGTASMGEVVDEKLRVFGVQRLRVVDASVMPNIVRGNTNSPVVMIAEKAADFIKKAHGAE